MQIETSVQYHQTLKRIAEEIVTITYCINAEQPKLSSTLEWTLRDL